MDKVYAEGLIGRKLGMSIAFDSSGVVPVTLIKAGPCVVLQVKTKEKDGYQAMQLGFESKKIQRVNKPMKGHFRAAGQGAYYFVKEIRCDVDKLGVQVGQVLNVTDIFRKGDRVDVTGNSKGRGFAGVVKRHNMSGQPASRGTHEYFRHVGSIGCRKFPGRVLKGKRMPGRYGNEQVTVVNLEVVGIDEQDNLIIVKGAVPGHKGSLVAVRRSKRGYDGTRVIEGKSDSNQEGDVQRNDKAVAQ
ncbi:MAG: 50S ribosomal protein L3 [Candidatus Dadabacteria bacterium]|nr:MAG: 50S ribosomal protein L3 [Candidatus Dadabacteria bacterium]